MDPKKLLTAFPQNGVARPDLVELLDRAGLELWQAPEGFWAIRLKPAALPPPAPAAPRRRPARRAA